MMIKRIQTYDKITTYPYGTNIFKICENEMLLKNKFNEGLNNKSPEAHVGKNNSQVRKNNSQAIRNELHELKNEAQVLSNNLQVNKDEAQSLRNKLQTNKNEIHKLINEAQILRNNFQATRNEAQVIRNGLHEVINEVQELRNYLQVNRDEAKALRNNSQAHKNKASVHRDNDMRKTIHNTAIDKINNKIGLIYRIDNILSNLNIKLSNNVKSIYEAIHELENEIYDDDPWLRLVELNKIKDMLDDLLNVIWYEIYEKNRISSNILNIDKYKDIDGYVSKLTDVRNNEVQLINKIGETINHIMHEINNKTNMVNEIIHKASVMDNDTHR